MVFNQKQHMTRKAHKITRLLLATSSLLWMSIMEQLHVTEGRLQFVDIGIRNSFDTAQKLKIKNVLHPKINDIF